MQLVVVVDFGRGVERSRDDVEHENLAVPEVLPDAGAGQATSPAPGPRRRPHDALTRTAKELRPLFAAELPIRADANALITTAMKFQAITGREPINRP